VACRREESLFFSPIFGYIVIPCQFPFFRYSPFRKGTFAGEPTLPCGQSDITVAFFCSPFVLFSSFVRSFSPVRFRPDLSCVTPCQACPVFVSLFSSTGFYHLDFIFELRFFCYFDQEGSLPSWFSPIFLQHLPRAFRFRLIPRLICLTVCFWFETPWFYLSSDQQEFGIPSSSS